MDWLEKLLSVDWLIRKSCTEPTSLMDGAAAKSGDFGFSSSRPESGVREVLMSDGNLRALAFHNTDHPKFKFTVSTIRTIPFEQIFNAPRLSKDATVIDKAQS